MTIIIKEIVTPSSKYKAEVVMRKEGLFEVLTYKWYEEYVEPYGLIADGWEAATKMKILVDTELKATQLVIEELQCLSGEILE
ncbi:hypothetical protein [Paenibacillus sp. FSL H8-0034]|uniref:hypothetical protein n=1 Tax=Paenibacillus sp. FSL H8-0034 TaxID=2954671 RepID=UPI0030F960CE